MDIDFIIQENTNTRLILIFAGWGTGKETGQGIYREGWDVAVAHSYNSLEFDSELLKRYYTIYVYAWSLGIYIASISLDPSLITESFAINGTLHPVHDTFGIPVNIYKGTLDTLDARNLAKFRRRMMPDASAYSRYILTSGTDNKTERDNIEKLQEQLKTIWESYTNHKNLRDRNRELIWTRAYIGKNDRIFPPQNMLRAWKQYSDTEIAMTDDSHWIDLPAIISETLPDTDDVKKHFTKARLTYDSEAVAQCSIAHRLAALTEEAWTANHSGRPRSLCEVGCGTGVYTKAYIPKLAPDYATFVDLTECPAFALAPKEEYITANAEQWLEKSRDKWDIITSASTVQWFADLPRFIRECAVHLSERGIIAMSAFLPGNLGELDAVRPSPLRYPTVSQLHEWLEKDFSDIRIYSERIKMEFKSKREILMHLKRTGVAGSAPSRRNSSEWDNISTLTYIPVYFTAVLK